MSLTSRELGTEKVVWDLATFYKSADDTAITADLLALQNMAMAFETHHRGQLGQQLGKALADYSAIVKLMTKIQAYFDLATARDAQNSVLRREASKAQETMTTLQGRYLTFFDLELGHMADADLEAQKDDAMVVHHMPMIQQTRRMAKYLLAEPVERSLTLRSPFGASEWADLMGELETKLRFAFEGKELSLPEMLHILTDDRDAERRAAALKIINDGLSVQKHAFFAARTLNVTIGSNLANDDERGFSHPMQSTNLGNMVDDATVKVLHEVVEAKGRILGERYYRLKAKLIGAKVLRWSDRNAPMPFAATTSITWEDACRMVVKAYMDFSPTLGALVEKVLDPQNGWVDAPPAAAKIQGAFDYTTVLPDGNRSYMLLNYLGTPNDVMTLAHELGHAVHGLLAADEQGPLMWHAPMPYAETASIFGEMLTFESMMTQLDDPKDKLALYMEKIGEFLNTVLRQISFSEFEQAFYAKRRDGKLSVEDFNALWMDIARRFYGKDGDVFTYADMEHMWCYVSHFYSYRPFYVYAYAFGELFTQSMMAVRGQVGNRFEPMYLDLLRAGGTKDAVALMAPFGLNPNERIFWEKGIEASCGVWMTEAERLATELGL